MEHGKALARLCAPDTANKIVENLTTMKRAAESVFEEIKAKDAEKVFDDGVKELEQWLDTTEDAVDQSFPLKYEAVRDRLQQLEVITM